MADQDPSRGKELTEKMEDIIEKVINETAKFDHGQCHWVDITCIKDPHNFYVRPTCYNEFMKLVESTEPTIPLENVIKNELILFNWGHTYGIKKYLRGMIVNTVEKDGGILCDILTMDYGRTERGVPMQHIWKCDQIFLKVPPLVYICHLSNCYPIHDKSNDRSFTAATINAFATFVGNEPASMRVVGHIGKKLAVVLINSNPYDIATLLSIRALSVVGTFRDPIQWNPIMLCKREQFKFKDYELNEKLHVRMQSGKSLAEFYVATISGINNHLTEIDNIKFYAKKEYLLFNNDIIEGTPVCAKNENKDEYERGFIKQVNLLEKKATVQLVDSGKDEDYPFVNLKYMSSNVLKRPVVSMFCSAGESQFWEDDLNKFLTPGYEFIITIKQMGQEFECPSVVEISPLDEGLDEATALGEQAQVF